MRSSIEPKNILVAGQSGDEATPQNISGCVYFNISTTKTLFCHKKAVFSCSATERCNKIIFGYLFETVTQNICHSFSYLKTIYIYLHLFL